MTPKSRDEYATATDGMPARRSGAWARDKLSFFDEFLPPALQATKDKVHRHYVDLFAGPGRNIDDEGAEFDGGAVRALKARAQSSPDVRFTHAHLVNLDRIAHDALRQRVDARCEDGSCAIPASAVQFDNDDANLLVGAIMRRIHKRAYAFIFADIEAPNQLPYDTVRALKFHGHESVDFCVLFPQGMALQRMLPMRRDKLAPTIEALNRYFGTDAWLELYDQRKTDAQSPELYRGIQKLYEDQLRKAGWMYAKEIRNVKRRGDAALYKILLATDKDVALRLASWSVEKERDRKGPELELGL